MMIYEGDTDPKSLGLSFELGKLDGHAVVRVTVVYSEPLSTNTYSPIAIHGPDDKRPLISLHSGRVNMLFILTSRAASRNTANRNNGHFPVRSPGTWTGTFEFSPSTVSLSHCLHALSQTNHACVIECSFLQETTCLIPCLSNTPWTRAAPRCRLPFQTSLRRHLHECPAQQRSPSIQERCPAIS